MPCTLVSRLTPVASPGVTAIVCVGAVCLGAAACWPGFDPIGASGPPAMLSSVPISQVWAILRDGHETFRFASKTENRLLTQSIVN